MNKKVSTIIIVSVCIVISAVLTVMYLVKTDVISTDNIFTNLFSNHSQSESSSSSAQTNKYPIAVLLREGAQADTDYDMSDEEDKPGSIYIKFNKLTITKTKGDFDVPDDFDERKDSEGNIINDYSYVICNATIINHAYSDVENAFNSLLLYIGEKGDYTELRSFDSQNLINNGRDFNRVDYFHFTFKKNKKYTVNLVFVVSDKDIEENKDDLLLRAGFSEAQGDSFPIIDKK